MLSLPTDSTRQTCLSFLNRVTQLDGSIQAFDASRIAAAICRAGTNSNELDPEDADELTMQVVLQRTFLPNTGALHVEQIEDIIEAVLFRSGHRKSLRAFIIEREWRLKDTIKKCGPSLRPPAGNY